MTHIDRVSTVEQRDSICLIIKVIMHYRPGLLKSADGKLLPLWSFSQTTATYLLRTLF